MIYLCHIHLYRRTSPLIWDTSIQETPQSRGHKIWSLKNVHIIFVFPMSIEGTLPLFRGKRHFFWVLKPGFNFHSGETLAIKLWLTTKIVDKFKCSLVTIVTAFKTWINSLKSMYCTCGNSIHSIVDDLAAWSNDCSRFRSLREQMPYSVLIKIFYLLVNYQQPQPSLHLGDTSIQGTLALVQKVSPE